MIQEVLLWTLRTVLFAGLILTLQSSYDIDLIQLESPWTIILYVWWFFSILFLFNAIIGMNYIIQIVFSEESSTPPPSPSPSITDQNQDQGQDCNSENTAEPGRRRLPPIGPGYMYIVGAAASAEVLSGLYMFIVAITWNIHGNCNLNWLYVLLVYTLLASLVMVGELGNQILWTVLPLLQLYICLLSNNCWGILLSIIMIYNYLIPSVNYEKDLMVVRVKSVVPVILGYTAVVFVMVLFLKTLHGNKVVRVHDFQPRTLFRMLWNFLDRKEAHAIQSD